MRQGVILASLLLSSTLALDAELTPATVAAFDRYVRHTEARMESESSDERRFLFVDALDDTSRRLKLAELRKGGLVIERLDKQDISEVLDPSRPNVARRKWFSFS